jgi:hypothetical protein
MVELAVTLPFLIAIVIGLIEMGIAFASYLSLVNATREGAIYASMHPELVDATQTPTSSTTWEEYVNRVANEVLVVVGERLKAGQLLTQDILTVDRPVIGPPDAIHGCPTGMEVGCPITVTTHFQIHTLTSDISLPYFGRFGLPSYYQINYSMGMPIR